MTAKFQPFEPSSLTPREIVEREFFRPVRDSVRGRTCTKKVVLVLVCFRSTSWYDLAKIEMVVPRTDSY